MLHLQGHIGSVSSLSFAGDGVHLASSGVAGNRVVLWDLLRGTRSERTAAHGVVHQVEFAPRGPALVARQSDTVTLWSEPLARTKPTATWAGDGFAFSPDGTEVAQSVPRDDNAHWLRFNFTADGGTSREPILVTGRRPLRVLWRAEGLYLFQRLRTTSGAIYLEVYHIDNANERCYRRLPSEMLTRYTVSPDARTLASVTAGEVAIRRCDFGTGQTLPSLTGHTAPVTALAYLPDGRLLSGDHAGGVRLWTETRCLDAKDWQLGPLTALTVAGDGMRAAVGSADGAILVWDLE